MGSPAGYPRASAGGVVTRTYPELVARRCLPQSCSVKGWQIAIARAVEPIGLSGPATIPPTRPAPPTAAAGPLAKLGR
jgi:hypothetical protein